MRGGIASVSRSVGSRKGLPPQRHGASAEGEWERQAIGPKVIHSLGTDSPRGYKKSNRWGRALCGRIGRKARALATRGVCSMIGGATSSPRIRSTANDPHLLLSVMIERKQILPRRQWAARRAERAQG